MYDDEEMSPGWHQWMDKNLFGDMREGKIGAAKLLKSVLENDPWVMVRDVAHKRLLNPNLTIKQYFKSLSLSDIYELMRRFDAPVNASMVNYMVSVLEIENYQIVSKVGDADSVVLELETFDTPFRRLILQAAMELKDGDNKEFRWTLFATSAEMDEYTKKVS